MRSDTIRIHRKLLLVEDGKVIACCEASLLDILGYSVKIAYSGEEAIQVIEVDRTIDLVLMDINLGKGINGAKAALRIRDIRGIPIVFLTSHSKSECDEILENIPHDGYIPKDSSYSIFRSAIEMAFELSTPPKQVDS
jgi:CheY-like chemotaxis protein